MLNLQQRTFSTLTLFSRTFSTMTLESFHDYRGPFRSCTLILFHDNNRSHIVPCLFTHGFADSARLCFLFCPAKLCFPCFAHKNSFKFSSHWSWDSTRNSKINHQSGVLRVVIPNSQREFHCNSAMKRDSILTPKKVG